MEGCSGVAHFTPDISRMVVALQLLGEQDHHGMVAESSVLQTTTENGADSFPADLLLAGGYYEGHPVIVAFWRVVQCFSGPEQHELLKFATACSRPPLLGFK
jgi:hypothetical protein